MPHRPDAAELATIINALPADSAQRSALQAQLEHEAGTLIDTTQRQHLQPQPVSPAAHDLQHKLDLHHFEQQRKRSRRRRIAGLSLALALSALVPIVLIVAGINADAPATGGGLIVGAWVAAYLEICAWSRAMDSMTE